MIVADIGLESCIVLLGLLLLTIDTGSDNLISRTTGLLTLVLVFTVPFILVLIGSARAPFDMPEAESELVAGSLTELGGTAFSFCLLIDYFEVLT
jgi:NADH-quinone oxidoreductase subunit H